MFGADTSRNITALLCAALLAGCVHPGRSPFDDDDEDSWTDVSSSRSRASTLSPRDAKLNRKLSDVRGEAEALTDVLRALPKGADLHNHTSGAISSLRSRLTSSSADSNAA